MDGLVMHDSHDIFYRNPSGAVPTGEKVTIRIKMDICVKSVTLRTWRNKIGEQVSSMILSGIPDGQFIYESVITVPEEEGLLWYYFIINDNDKILYYGNNSGRLGGEGNIYEYPPESYQVTVYKKDFETPEWFRDCVMYQIFVDRFFNGSEDGRILGMKENIIIHQNWYEKPIYRVDPDTKDKMDDDFFGGNLEGIVKKLPYLRELGIDVIYLNPIFESPSNHKYNTSDYKKIDSMFGDEKILAALCEKANEYNISIVLDGVFSHTGSDSVYFNKYGRYEAPGACQSKDSPYYPWYNFKSYPDDYGCWWNVKTLPNVNEMDPSYLSFIMDSGDSVLKHWMAKGIKGWRLDVVDELPDEFLKRLRKTVKSCDPDSIIIGEVWEDASNKESYGKIREYLLGDEIDSAMNYPLRNALIKFILGEWNGKMLNSSIMSLYENYPPQCFYSMMNLMGSHDLPRLKTILGGWVKDPSKPKEDERDFILTREQEMLSSRRMRMVSLFQMTFPGVPCIYYGDEAGLQGCSDPFNRGTYPWGIEDKGLLGWYGKVIELRHSYDMLRTGNFVPVYCDKDIYGYARLIENGRDTFGEEKENGFALMLFNRSLNETHDIQINLQKWNVKNLYDAIDYSTFILDDECLHIKLHPLDGRILVRF